MITKGANLSFTSICFIVSIVICNGAVFVNCYSKLCYCDIWTHHDRPSQMHENLLISRANQDKTRHHPKCPLVFKNIVAYNNQFDPTMFFYEISWIHAISPRDCFEHAILSQPLYHIKYMNQGIKHHKQNHNTYHFVYKVFCVINILLYLNEYNFLPWKMCVCHS